MNLRKSIKIALAKKEKDQSWLANEMGCSKQHISYIIQAKNVGTDTVVKISDALDLKPSELLALGEDDE